MNGQFTVGSLFTGIGGFDLGFERAGMRTVWQVEQSEFCRRVLERHFPGAARYTDVRGVHGYRNCSILCRECLAPVDVVCGGFPCQDISSAGAKVGIGGPRSSLWAEYARIVGELRPRYVVVENVADLVVRGLDTVVTDLAALGYDAEWDCLPASAFGAPHARNRLWLVAYPNSDGEPSLPVDEEARRDEDASGRRVADDVGNPDCAPEDPRTAPGGKWDSVGESGWWTSEPAVGRVADGLSPRLDRLRLTALGNALVPQIAEWIGRRIVAWEQRVSEASA